MSGRSSRVVIPAAINRSLLLYKSAKSTGFWGFGATAARAIVGTDARTPVKAPLAAPLNPLAANPSAAPAIPASAATDAPPVTAPNPIEVAKLIKLLPKTSLYGYASTVKSGVSGIGTGLCGVGCDWSVCGFG